MRKRAVVSGRVQGVGFRWSAVETAQRLGVTGTVRNLPDGRVEAVVSGDTAAVDAMIDWLRQGPPHAHVDDVETEDLPDEDQSDHGFRIVRS